MFKKVRRFLLVGGILMLVIGLGGIAILGAGAGGASVIAAPGATVRVDLDSITAASGQYRGEKPRLEALDGTKIASAYQAPGGEVPSGDVKVQHGGTKISPSFDVTIVDDPSLVGHDIDCVASMEVTYARSGALRSGGGLWEPATIRHQSARTLHIVSGFEFLLVRTFRFLGVAGIVALGAGLVMFLLGLLGRSTDMQEEGG